MTTKLGRLEDLRILAVDDERPNIDVLRRLLSRRGYRNLRTTTDPREVVGLFRELEPDLLLLDLRMPGMDGFEVMAALRKELPRGHYFPILVLTGDLAPEVKQQALSAGATDFLTKPFDTTEALLRIRNLLETRALHRELRRQNETLEERVGERTRELAEAQVEILHRLALAAEYRDDLTGRHAERVGLLSALLAEELGLPDHEIRLIRRAATLHDLGKIGIPDEILMKPGPLTAREFDVIRQHTEIGGRILSGSHFPLLRMAREIALSHHERWDGSGYCGGLSGEAIPVVGRIVAVADAFDSLCHERPYKAAVDPDRAARIIRGDRESHFDPKVIDAFLELADRGVARQLDEMVRATLEGGPPDREAEFPVLLDDVSRRPREDA